MFFTRYHPMLQFLTTLRLLFCFLRPATLLCWFSLTALIVLFQDTIGSYFFI